jgi:hypothetical protein
MESGYGGRSKLLFVLILAALAAMLWLLSLLSAYTDFQGTRLTDPLAEVHSLSPLYYAALVLSALACVGCFVWRVRGRAVHLVLLLVLAAVLWLTPYLIAGFVRLPDAPWHVGVAQWTPEVLNGEPVLFDNYAWDYPASFVYHYAFMGVTSVGPLTYIAVFPGVSMLVFIILCYSLAARLFNDRVALLSMLVAIPGLHYLQLHVSPHALGALLMLTVLLLLVVGRGAARVLPVAAVLTILLIVAHPTMPLLLSIFLAAALVVGVVRLRGIGRVEVALAGLTALAFAGWFFWYAFHPGSHWKSAEEVYQNISPAQLGSGTDYVTGTKFIYGGIFALNKAVYFLYGAVGVLAVCLMAARAFLRRTGMGSSVRRLCGLKRSEAMLVVSIPPLLVLTFLLAGRSHVLIETGLTYLVIAISCVVASIVVRTGWIDRRPGRASVTVAALFLALTFPVLAYSIDAYSSFPKSEEAGLRFLAEHGALDGKTVATTSVTQLALYEGSLPVDAHFVEMNEKGGYDLAARKPDLIAFRSTGYYYDAMRFDLSFEDNRYNQELELIENSDYKKVYDSPTFHVYSD